MSAPTARAPADGIYPSLYLHSYSTTSLSLPSYFKNPPHLFTSIFYPSIYSFLLSLSLYPLPPLPLPLSLPFHISTLFLSLCLVLTFIPFYLCPLLLNPASLPLYLHLPPLYPLHLHSSISLHPSTSLPLSLFLPLATLLFVPSISLFFPLTALSNLAPRFIVP